MNKEQETIVKKSKLIRGRSMADASIDQYCQSVAELLKNINEKADTRPHVNMPDEPQLMDCSDDLFQY